MIGDIDSDTVDVEIRNYLKIDLPFSKDIIGEFQIKINTILREVYEIRYTDIDNISFATLSHNIFFLIRFLDDISNIY